MWFWGHVFIGVVVVIILLGCLDAHFSRFD